MHVKSHQKVNRINEKALFTSWIYMDTFPFNLLTNMLRRVASNTPHCIVLMESNITAYHILCQKGLSQLAGLDTEVFSETQ